MLSYFCCEQQQEPLYGRKSIKQLKAKMFKMVNFETLFFPPCLIFIV